MNEADIQEIVNQEIFDSAPAALAKLKKLSLSEDPMVQAVASAALLQAYGDLRRDMIDFDDSPSLIQTPYQS